MPENRKNTTLPVGFDVPGWTHCDLPPRLPMQGLYCRLDPLDVACHAKDLYEANSKDIGDIIWTYMAYGPIESFEAYCQWMETTCLGHDPLFHAVIDLKTGKAVGVASYLRIDPANGVVEVGHINYSPALQRTPAGTEAMYLMMKRVFDELGYRRYEWKCDNLNARSKRAAIRYGMTYEGTFRQAVVSKGRNRDTAWFAIIDKDWPPVKNAFEDWLSPENFDANGKEKHSLKEFIISNSR